MELFILYLWLKLDVFIGIFTALGFIFSVLTLICFIVVANHNDSAKWTWSKEKKISYSIIPWKRLVSVVGICFLMSNFIPNKADTAILVGAHYALKVAETPEAAKVMKLLRQKANDLLDEELNKTTKKVEQK